MPEKEKKVDPLWEGLRPVEKNIRTAEDALDAGSLQPTAKPGVPPLDPFTTTRSKAAAELEALTEAIPLDPLTTTLSKTDQEGADFEALMLDKGVLRKPSNSAMEDIENGLHPDSKAKPSNNVESPDRTTDVATWFRTRRNGPAEATTATRRNESFPGAFPVSPTSNNNSETEQPAVVDDASDGSSPNNDDPPQDNNDDDLVCATVVGDAELEAEFRTRILQEAVQAQVHEQPNQEEEEAKPSSSNKVLVLGVVILILVIVVFIAVGVSVANKDDKSNNSDSGSLVGTTTMEEPPPDYSHLSTLELVKQRDHVICGTYFPSPGLVAWSNVTNRMEGLLADICRAIAAVTLGDFSKVEFVFVGPFDRFPLLHNRTIDVVTEPATFTMERDVRESNIQAGLSFSAPFYYSGLGFAGKEEYIDCMDRFDVSTGVCRGVQLCVTAHTTHVDTIREHVPAALAIVEESSGGCLQKFLNGEANVVSGEPISLNEKQFRDVGYDGPIYFTHNVLSREPLSMVTRDADIEWSDLVNSIMDMLYTAEGLDLTQQQAKEALELGVLPALLDNGMDEVLANRMLTVVAVAGHYGEIYQQSLQDQLPRGGLNQLNVDGDSGLLYSFPFGYRDNLAKLDPTIEPGPKIDAIIERGTLRCGVMERPGFAELINETSWYGMDVELCRALAAALFRSEEGTLEIVQASGFEDLADSSIDVLAGAPLTLTNKYKEPSTGGLSFAFSLPYFYGEEHEVLGLATNRKDTKFADLLYWLVMALVYAEEEQITSSNATMMPAINLFGDNLKQWMIDCVSRVGNYGDIYGRTLDPLIPRSGRNLLNDLEAGLEPQQFPISLV